ncbi:Hypothetical predicted protein [Cloeon dipterum]|uniref:Hyaluronidase n=2 Tax=Cloeon dipterum TaxID=197152 RepID=A0A8S1DJ31_9INSE|nr:Hypothetical predicted protein [Cloeon dipterum]
MLVGTLIFLGLVLCAKAQFEVHWNVPTFMCHKHGVVFDATRFGITQNDNDQFRGDSMVILYDPGLFPAYLTDEPQEEGIFESIFGRQKYSVIARNGGLPQLGNLTQHLNAMKESINQLIPNPMFSGVGVIDFESWRPTYRQNWASLNIYRDKSKALEKKLHPFWSKESIENEAEKRFEQYGRLFMESTLKLAKDLRPRARWGYYAFPYCYNYTPKNKGFDCPAEVKTENNELNWLYSGSDALFPSLYMSRQKLTPEQHYKFVFGRVNEAKRLANRIKPKRPDVLPYVWYRYYDEQEYLTEEDVYNSIGGPRTLGLKGVVLWGSAKDVNSKEKCLKLQKYVEQTLGPAVQHIRTASVAELEKRLTGKKLKRSNLPEGFWTNYFLDPIVKILRRRTIRNK